MKILNKFIWSKKEPSNKNDIWFDGSTWKVYTEEAWQSFTLSVDDADKVAKVLENASEVYQEKLNAGYGIVIEGNTISVDNSDVWEAIETLQQNKVEQTQLDDYVPFDRYASTSQVLIDSINELDSIKLNKTDVPTPDWSASTYKDGHIKNRTHHLQDYMCYEFKGSPVSISKPNDTGYVLLTYDTDMAEKYMKIEIKAGEYKTEEFVDAMGLPIIFTWDGNSTINVQTFGGALETYGMRAYYSSSAKGYDEYFVALDEGFIPRTIARKADIPTKVSQLEQDVPGGGGSYDDTEIKDKLTELSAEVSELSEKVDELGKPIFKAVFGETTYDEIVTAYNNGMVVHCDYGGNCYVLTRIDSTNSYFVSVLGTITYRLNCTSSSVWGSAVFEAEQIKNKVTSLSSASTNTQYPSAKAVYDATQQMMPATPSGDPMHYMYIAAGCIYNEETKLWSYGGKDSEGDVRYIDDLTTEDVRNAYMIFPSFSHITPFKGMWGMPNVKTRFVFCTLSKAAIIIDGAFQQNDYLELVYASRDIIPSSMVYALYECKNLRYFHARMQMQHISSQSALTMAFAGCKKLETIKLYKIKHSYDFKDSSLLSNGSILYMITNESATSAITITLHAEAYDRAMADAEITAALAEHPNVSLASA